MNMAELSPGQGTQTLKELGVPASNGKDLSQEGLIVGNPLVSVETSERQLSEQEKTILWANQVFEEYNNLPRGNSKERKRTKHLIHKAADRLLQRPEDIDIVGSVWKSHEPVSQEGSLKQQSFYELVREVSSQQAKDHWKEITSEKLTELVKTYAYSRLVPDMAEEMLAGYFRGPNGMQQRVDSVYKLVYGLIDLATDQQALTKGLQIVRFEGPTLKRDSAFDADMKLAGGVLDDDAILGKAMGVNTTILALSRLVPIYNEANIRSFLRGSDTEGDQRRMQAMVQRLRKKFSLEVILDRIDRLKQVFSLEFMRLDEGSKREWPFTLVSANSNPLRMKLAEQIGPLEFAARIRDEMSEVIKNNKKANPIFVSTPIQDGFIMTIAMPDYLSVEQKSAITRTMLETLRVSEKDREALMDPDIPAITDTVLYDGIEIPVLRRRISIIDRNKHELSALEAIGLPTPNLDGRDLLTVNQELAEDIQKHQIRFLNKRGVRVPIEIPELSGLGYTSINFNRDSNSDKISATILLGELSYKVKLDKYMIIDLEGKFVDSPFLIQRIHYVLLSLLKPLLCEERIKDPHLPEMGLEEKEVVSRMGHLRWLPAGQRFSKTAVENFFRFEGKDLFAVNFQRLEEHNTKRETTYVKPVIEKEENLPPITIHLPGVLQFN